MEFKSSFKVYYEDTDSGGIVYYANYLKFLERARTDAITSIDCSNSKLVEKFGIYIIVKSCKLNFIKPAKLEDNLDILSKVLEIKNVSIRMKQNMIIDMPSMNTLMDKYISTNLTCRSLLLLVFINFDLLLS